MTKQVKPAKILWRYCLSLPYHDYRPHMSCNEIDECNAGVGFRCFLLSRHVANKPSRQEATACSIPAYRGAGFTRGGSILQLKVKGRLFIPPCALTPKCASERYSLLMCLY